MPVTEMKFTDADLRILAAALELYGTQTWQLPGVPELRETINDRLEAMKGDE